MKKFLVTGSKGFIGSNLISELLNLGHKVISIDDEYLNKKDWKSELTKTLNQKFNCVFHVGACSDTLKTDVNYMMLRNYETTKFISDWCRKNNTPLIYSSSAANYGVNNQYPSNLYGWSKYVGESYVVANLGIGLRYFNVYGPGESHKGRMASVAYQMFLKQKSGEQCFLFPKKPLRDFVYVKDIVSANIYAYKNFNKNKGKWFEVGSGKARSFEDVLQLMGIPFTYESLTSIPYGYQFYTCSNKSKWIPGWKPLWNLKKGIGDYKKYLYITK